MIDFNSKNKPNPTCMHIVYRKRKKAFILTHMQRERERERERKREKTNT